MKRLGYIKLSCQLAVLASLHVGCMQFGRDFNYQNIASLELGERRGSDYKTEFGLPSNVTTKITPSGKIELVSYRYLREDGSGMFNSRLLILEYRDGVLNSYNHFSSFPADRTAYDPDGLALIEQGISKQSDVLRILGKPHGMARCPSEAGDYRDKCEKGAEVWCWTAMTKRSVTLQHGAQQVKVRERDFNQLLITFDQNGVVVDLGLSQVIHH